MRASTTSTDAGRVSLMATASPGRIDPTEATATQSRA